MNQVGTRTGLATVVAALALVAMACAGAPPATPGQRDGVGTRELEVALSGAASYGNQGAIDSGGLEITYDNASGVTSLEGSVTIPGVSGGEARVTFDLDEALGTYSGPVRVQDPGAGVDTTVEHFATSLAFDADGDASGSAESGGVRLTWSVETIDATVLEPALDELHDEEDTFCVDAQRSLAGVDEADLPDGAIANTVHTSRAAFGSSKASLSPLAVQTWSDTAQVDSAAGNNLAISHRISCKTRAADHLATTGVPVGASQQCSVLTQRSIELARSRMSAQELADYDASGRQVVLVGDRMAGTGSEYLTPFNDERIVGDTLEVQAGSLRTDWEDPAYVLFPDTIRGVHYCTVWSPAWAYWWMTEGAFQPV